VADVIVEERSQLVPVRALGFEFGPFGFGSRVKWVPRDTTPIMTSERPTHPFTAMSLARLIPSSLVDLLHIVQANFRSSGELP
jgi:hypothetical protein